MKIPEAYANLLSEPHIYIHSRLRKLGFGYVLVAIIVFLGTSVLALVWKRNTGMFLATLVEALFFVVLGLILWRTTKHNFLITGQEGIIFTRAGFTAFSPWENIARIANAPFWRGYDALQLREAPADMPIVDGIQEHRAAMQITKGAIIMMGPKSNSPYDIYHYIPLLFLRRSWRKGKLKNDFERYAPWLLQGSPHVTPQV